MKLYVYWVLISSVCVYVYMINGCMSVVGHTCSERYLVELCVNGWVCVYVVGSCV